MLVVEIAQLLDVQFAGCGEQAVLIVQVAALEIERQVRTAHQSTAVLHQGAEGEVHVTDGGNGARVRGVEAGRRELQAALAVDQPGIAVIQLAIDSEVKIATAGQGAAAVIQRAGGGVDAGGRDHALDVVQGLADAHHQGLVAQQLAVAVVEGLRCKGEALGAGDLAALVVDDAKVLQRQGAWRVDQAGLVVQLAVIQVQA